MRGYLVGLALLAFVQTSPQAAPPAGDRRTVPNLVGKSGADATAALHAAGFENDLEIDGPTLDCGEHPPKVEDRQILCQKPEAGAVVDKGTYIYAVTYHQIKHDGVLVHDQLDALLGLTLDQAKAKLKELGFVGPLEIAPLPQFVEKCGIDKVCGHEPITAVGIREKLRLFVNPKVEISAPPP